jgi:hypothetical protein
MATKKKSEAIRANLFSKDITGAMRLWQFPSLLLLRGGKTPEEGKEIGQATDSEFL